MNEKQPYEKHLADKMQHLPPPGDSDRSWVQMKSMLDKEMPEGGGVPPIGGRRSGPTRWWMIGILVGVITIGTWLSTKQSDSTAKDVTAVKQESTEQKTSPSSGSDQPSSAPNENSTASSSATVAKADPNSPANNLPAEKNSTANNSKVSKANNQPSNDNNSSTILPTTNESSIVKNNDAANSTKEVKAKEVKTNKKTSSSNPRDLGIASGTTVATVKNKPGVSNSNKSITNNTKTNQNNKSIAGLSDSKSTKGNANNSIAPASKSGSDVNQVADDFVASLAGLNFGIDKSASAFGERDAIINGSVDSRSIASMVPKPPAKPGRRYNRDTKSFEPRSDKKRAVGTGDEKNMVFGISLPLGFPVGDQQAVAYNFNAGPNTISDYLPSPHFQYHLNDKSFIQSELQFVAPQFIQPVLLSQQRQEITSMQTKYTSIYAKKLYYFNMPFSAYYSPFNHFYLGTGFQFSSMLSGVAMNEQKLYTVTGPNSRDSSITTDYMKFRNDTLSSKFNGSEFRLLFDANYYWQKFTVGLRYNQAFSNYISIRATPTADLFQDRNKTVQFYLRYNFWEDKKKKKPTNAALTSK